MSFSALQYYIHSIIVHIPWWHWAIIGILSMSFMVLFSVRKWCSVYGGISLGITVFIGLLIFYIAVLSRFGDSIDHSIRYDFAAEYNRLIYGNEMQRIQILLNLIALVPFGVFLSVFLSEIKTYSYKKKIGFVTLTAFGVSMCIECSQLVFHLGIFELTDIVMNTIGGFLGTSIEAIGRSMIMGTKSSILKD